MRESLESLSFGSLAGIVALISVLLSIVWANLPSRIVGWVVAVIAPFIVAYSLYWLPVWLGADDLEFGAWAGVFIVPWYLIGLIASSLGVFLFRRPRQPGIEG